MDFGNGWDSRLAVKVPQDRKEAFRYMGYGNAVPDPEVEKASQAVWAMTIENARPQAFYRIYPIEELGGGRVSFCGQSIKSRDLEVHLEGCSHVILLAATLGHMIDAKLRLLGKTEVSGQMMLQAVSAAFLETYLDQLQNEISDRAKEEGWYLTSRFSPGYGDLSMEYQRMIDQELQIEKRLGIVFSDSLLMIPSKSVTAFIGVGREEKRKIRTECVPGGCKYCSRECTYRKENRES